MPKITEKQPTESLIDRLEAKYRVKAQTFEVTLPEGEKMTFKHIQTASERKAMRIFVTDFADRISEGKVHPNQKQYLPIDRDIAASLGVISFLSVEPKLSELDVLKLHRLPAICDLISQQMQDAAFEATVGIDIQEIEDAKKD